MQIRDIARRFAGLARRRGREHRLDAEVQFHLDMLAERHRRSGDAPEEARRKALVAFGGAERFKDAARDEYRSRFADELGQDVRYAVRVIKRQSGFAVAAALTFALGVGAATAIFSLVHGVLLRPLPYADPNRLVVLWERNAALGNDRNVVSVSNFEVWRAQASSFDAMAALVPLPATLTGTSAPEHVMGGEVSPAYFAVLGVRPALGRTFSAAEERDGGANVLVLSDGFWRSRFGADRGVLGRALAIDGRSHTIIGVMPPGFDPPKFAWLGEQAFWRPFGPTDSNRGWGRFLLIVARVKHDVPITLARQELESIAARRASEDRSNAGWSATLVGLSNQITGDVRTPLLVLFGAVGLLLVMAATNVANLTLGLVRRSEHELAIRRAIGATSSRLVRQIMTQGAVVGAIGGIVGVIVAVGGVRALAALLPADVPRATSIRIDGAVLLFATLITVTTALCVGAIAALRGGSQGTLALRETGGRAAARLRGGSLVTAEIALGLVLTVLAGLAVRTFVALRSVDLGFNAEHVVIARVSVSGPRYATPQAYKRFFDQLLARVRAMPGVEAASVVSTRPFGGMGPATTLGDAAKAATGDSILADVRYADGALFQALRVPLVAGATFDSRDAPGVPPRAVVNRALARRLWPNENAIGKRLRVPMFNGIAPEVIGVVGDMHLMDARTPARGTVYLPVSTFPADALDLVIRGTSDGEALVASLRSVVGTLDAGAPVYAVTTLDGLLGRSLARDRFTAVLLGAFAVVSLLLAVVGIYSVFAADVSQRRKEIGIRVALGAPSLGVIALVIRRAIVRAAVGIALGSAAALFAARAMQSLLFGVGVTDPVSFFGVAGLLLAVAIVATLVPALKAARVSPLVAIRTD